MNETLFKTLINLLENVEVTDEQLNKAVNHLDLCADPQAILLLLKLKENRVSSLNTGKIKFSLHQIEQMFYFKTEYLDVLCDIIMKILFVAENVDETISYLVNIIHKEIQRTENEQDFRVVKIMNCITVAIVKDKQYNNIHLDFRNSVVDDFLIKSLSVTSSSNLRNFIVFELLPNYIQIIDKVGLLNILDKIFILSIESSRLDVFCALFTKSWNTISKLIEVEGAILNKFEFYEFLSNSLVAHTFLQKEAAFILQILINDVKICHKKIPYLTTSTATNCWRAFFTLIEAAKEKQLHLIRPAMFLLNDIKTLHSIWWIPVFSLFLEHSQTLVTYEVAKYVVTDWPTDLSKSPTEESKLQLKMFIKLLFKAINRNEHSSCTKQFFSQLTIKCEMLNYEYYSIILSEIVNHNWSPTALWNVLKSVVNKHVISEDWFITLLNIALNLPNLYIRKGCVKLLINHYCIVCCADANFNQLIKFLEVLKVKDSTLYFNFIRSLPERHIDILLAEISEKDFSSLDLEHILLFLNIVGSMRKSRKTKTDLIRQALMSIEGDKKLYIYLDFYRYIDDEEVIEYLELFFNKYLTNANVKSWYKLMNRVLTYGRRIDNSYAKKYVLLFKWITPHDCDEIHKNILIAIYLNLFSDPHNCDEKMNIVTAIRSQIPDLDNNIIDMWRNNLVHYPEWVEVEFLGVYFTKYLATEIGSEKAKEFIYSILEKSQEIEKKAYEFLCSYLMSDLVESCHEVIDNSRLLSYIEIFILYLPKLKSNKCRDMIYEMTSVLHSQRFDRIRQNNVEFKRILTKTLHDLCLAQPAVGYHWVQFLCIRSHNCSIETIVEFIPIVVDLYLQGTCVKKEHRIEYAVCREVNSILANIPEINKFFTQQMYFMIPYLSISSPVETSMSIRMCALHTICIMASKVNENNSCIVPQIIRNLFDRYILDEQKRYFPDSEAHYQRLRIFQAILLVTNYSPSSKFSFTFANKLLEILITEPQQNDVRQIMEWIVLRITHKLDSTMQKEIIETIANLIKNRDKESSSSVPTLMLLLYHLTIVSRNEPLWSETLQILLPWTMGATFKARVHAQEAIKRLILKAKEIPYGSLLEKYGYLEQVINSCIESSAKAFYDTLKSDSVLYASFDFLQDFSFESICYQIPKLNGTFPYEWENIFNYRFGQSPVKIHNDNSVFNEAVNKFLEKTCHNDDSNKFFDHSNFQLKITPWKRNIGNLPLEATNDFILVASLIDKPQNLGGLMRTCEVYGIKQIVLHDSKVVGSKDFKSLSMSSEHWVNILEIKVPSLEDFLKSIKRELFSIVGAEQTCDSKSLSQYNFQKKTVLVLGNEKEGIPPNLISLMDVCVEIPQLGQIRSLNVHVAGAICVWEYMKQHKL